MSGYFTNDAEARLDALEAQDPPLYGDVMDAVDFVIDRQAVARPQADALRARDGTAVWATVVRGPYQPPYHVIWTLADDRPLILGYGRLRPE